MMETKAVSDIWFINEYLLIQLGINLGQFQAFCADINIVCMLRILPQRYDNDDFIGIYISLFIDSWGIFNRTATYQ